MHKKEKILHYIDQLLFKLYLPKRGQIYSVHNVCQRIRISIEISLVKGPIFT